jgi:hypothetical protein
MSYDASMYELQQFRKQMEETEKLPLAERKANAVEWFRALNEDHMMVAERVGWLLQGNYGGGSFGSACRVLASPRMNQVAWCAITIANLEWRCPAKMAIMAWKKLSVEKRYLVNEAIRREIADAKAEGYCGEIKKNGYQPYEFTTTPHPDLRPETRAYLTKLAQKSKTIKKYETVVELRQGFWREFPNLSRKKVWVGPGQTDFPMEVRVAWRNWLEMLVMNGVISESLATRASLLGLYKMS